MTTVRAYRNLASAVVLVNLAWLLPILTFAAFWSAAFALTALKAKVLTDMWLWFAVPAGFKPISFAQSIGLITIVSFLTVNPISAMGDKTEEGESKWGKALGKMIFVSYWVMLCWAGAYIWHWYLG